MLAERSNISRGNRTLRQKALRNHNLEEQARNIFIRRYWYCDATADIAKRYGIGESKVRVTLHRMRTKLKAYLEKEGVCL